MRVIFNKATKDMVLCGDVRQLPAVRQIPIYKRTTFNFAGQTVWLAATIPLQRAVRQMDVLFSRVLAKIGNGDEPTIEKIEYREARMRRSRNNRSYGSDPAIRLFQMNADIDECDHAHVIVGRKVRWEVTLGYVVGGTDANLGHVVFGAVTRGEGMAKGRKNKNST